MSWYKQDRDLFERSWANDAEAVAVYVYLHCAALVNDKKLHGLIIRRGSCLTSRKLIADATGLGETQVRLRLRKLLEEKEIIIKTTNKGTIITLCDYDGYNESEELFQQEATSQQPANNQPITSQQPALYNNRIIDNKNNIRSYPSNKERENNKSVAYEIKAIYNKTFAGVLPEWMRLSDKMAGKVADCVEHYGRQSVDMVFDQVLHEKFSLGKNDTGFIADFDFIFRLDEYERYLSRYELRQSRKKREEHGRNVVDGTKEAVTREAGTNINSEKTPTREEKRRSFLLSWITGEAEHPTKRGQQLLKACYDSGEMAKLGIDWKPKG